VLLLARRRHGWALSRVSFIVAVFAILLESLLKLPLARLEVPVLVLRRLGL
jgi:hypothetical protein